MPNNRLNNLHSIRVGLLRRRVAPIEDRSVALRQLGKSLVNRIQFGDLPVQLNRTVPFDPDGYVSTRAQGVFPIYVGPRRLATDGAEADEEAQVNALAPKSRVLLT